MREYLVCTMRDITLPVRIAVVLSVLQLVHASWWYLGVASSYQPIVDELNHRPGGAPRAQLARARGGRNGAQLLDCSDLQFMGPRQRELCALDKSLIHVISNGASMGIEECQHQFSDFRWNCSTFNNTSVFGNILSIQSRETAYIYAISSAGIMYAVTRACSKGDLLNCSCDRRVRRRYKTDGTFEWGGCSDNIRYGAKFSQEFVDSNERRINAEGLMNLWNNGAGRKAAKSNTDVKCKCHGVSGSCSVKICWRKLKPFRAIGKELKDKFEGASYVRLDVKRRRLKRVNKLQKRPRKNDLVYLMDSPDFCEYNPKVGSLGTRGRRCNKTSYALDGCKLMCCGRGYYTLIKEEVEDCDCKFYWCCRVVCKKCTHKREIHYCN